MVSLLAINNLSGTVWCLLGVLASVGLLAMFSPQSFSVLATRGSDWVDTNKLLAVLDKRIDIDKHVLPFSRVLGFAVLASAILIGVLLSR